MSRWRSQFSGYASRLTPSAIPALADMPRAADTIAFGPGEPDPALFPAEEDDPRGGAVRSAVIASILRGPR